MKLKNAIFILAVLLCCNFVFAQTKRDSTKFEIGLGQTFLPSFKSISWNSFFPNISIKYKFSKNAFRTGLSLNNYAPVYKGYQYLGNIGYERRLFGPIVQMILGVDFCVRHNYFGNVDYNNSTYYWGAGPVIGCIYNISKRFSLQTELSFFYGPYAHKNYPYANYWRKYDMRIQESRDLSLHLYYKFGKK